MFNAYDSYGDFSLELYFANKYDKIPSELGIYLDVEENQENFNRALSIIDFTTFKLSIVQKKWTISKNKDAKESDDYVYAHIVDSADVSLCLEIDLNNDQLSVEFLYDSQTALVEDWIKQQIEQLRNEFATSKSPVFRILTKTRDNFETQKVKVDLYEIEIDKNYNDDFIKIDQDINTAIEQKQSGLILLHGKPGTGKTSYIKHLIGKHSKNKFIFIPNDFVDELLKPAFITFMIRQKNAILVIEDAEKIIMSRNYADKNSVVSTILQLTDGLFSDYLNIKVICTFNTDISKVDKALFRKGRMIAFYEFKALSLEKTIHLLNDKSQKITEGLTLAEIYNFNKNDYSDATTKKYIGFK